MPDHPPLARRLRALRETGLVGRSITQRQLAKAFGASEPTSSPLISSWENDTAVPPASRLDAYATFFATERSVAREPYRLLPTSELTPEELSRRKELLHELTDLRDAMVSPVKSPAESLWHFASNQDITIICAELPENLRHNLSYADPDSPDFVKLYRFTDLDALVEVYGHIRALNPTNRVSISTPSASKADLFTAHLVALGGVDWNMVTRDLLRVIEIPVRQVAREQSVDIGGFQVGKGEKAPIHKPIVRVEGDQRVLVEDVAHFYRGPNPFNEKRTVTICNGMFGRGVLGAVRALTDARFRDRNEEYAREHLGLRRFSIVSRVYIVSGEVVTPDWTRQDTRLHQWPEEPSEYSGTRQ